MYNKRALESQIYLAITRLEEAGEPTSLDRILAEITALGAFEEVTRDELWRVIRRLHQRKYELIVRGRGRWTRYAIASPEYRNRSLQERKENRAMSQANWGRYDHDDILRLTQGALVYLRMIGRLPATTVEILDFIQAVEHKSCPPPVKWFEYATRVLSKEGVLGGDDPYYLTQEGIFAMMSLIL